jgi:hypothetical protein
MADSKRKGLERENGDWWIAQNRSKPDDRPSVYPGVPPPEYQQVSIRSAGFRVISLLQAINTGIRSRIVYALVITTRRRDDLSTKQEEAA